MQAEAALTSELSLKRLRQLQKMQALLSADLDMRAPAQITTGEDHMRHSERPAAETGTRRTWSPFSAFPTDYIEVHVSNTHPVRDRCAFFVCNAHTHTGQVEDGGVRLQIQSVQIDGTGGDSKLDIRVDCTKHNAVMEGCNCNV